MELEFFETFAVENEHYNLQRELNVLLYSENSQDRQYCARHKNVTLLQTAQLVNDRCEFVRAAVIKSPVLPISYIDILINDPSATVRAAVAEYNNLRIDQILKLVDDPSVYVKRTIATHPLLPYHSVDSLVNDVDFRVRKSVAYNNNLLDKHIDQLVNDKIWTVRWAIAKHKKLSIEHIEILSKDHANVKLALVRNEIVDTKTIQLLAEDEHSSVSIAAKYRLNNPLMYCI